MNWNPDPAGMDKAADERFMAAMRRLDEHYDAIPAVAPDDDPEDTIARFDGLVVSIPPYPGYQSRKTVEEQYDPADERAANGATIAAVAFVAGVVVGSVLSAVAL